MAGNTDGAYLRAGGGPNGILVLEAGINDAFSGATVLSAVYAQLAAMQAAGYAAGFSDVVFCTGPQWVNGSPSPWGALQIAQQAGINAWILANAGVGANGASRVARWDLEPKMALVSGGTAYDDVYRHNSGPNVGHPTDAGYLALAGVNAAVCQALKR